jgi:hypothetical protein
MEVIEKATGKSIIRIETTDLDVMEEVRARRLISILMLLTRACDPPQQMKKAMK